MYFEKLCNIAVLLTILFAVKTSELFNLDFNSSKSQLDVQGNNTFGNDSAYWMRYRRMAFRDRNYPLSIWIDGVPFRISSALSAHAIKVILKSIKFWNDNTCINFVMNGDGRNRLEFIPGPGCYSSIGRVWFKEKQYITVGSQCEHFHTITHELAHTLGLFHTHNRPDRQQYVDINEESVLRSQQGNFRVESSIACTTYNLPYEYGSVMHYRKSEFSANKKPTVLPKNRLYENTIGSGTGPSFLDVLLVNLHYNCHDRCKDSKTVCKNGGYPHPRDCKKCICPSGFAGTLCDQRDTSTSCGGELKAGTNPITLAYRNFLFGLQEEMYFCYWWIIAPKNSTLNIEIVELDAFCIEGCLLGGLEIKAEPDKRLTGYRLFWSPDLTPKQDITELLDAHTTVLDDKVWILDYAYILQI